MPPASSTTNQEPKNSLAYKIRTMASDIDALKKGAQPLHSEVTIDPKTIPQANKIKPSFPQIEPLKQAIQAAKPPVPEPRKLEINKEEVKVTPTPQPKIEAPPIIKSEEIKTDLSKPLISPPQFSPKISQPFETPIKKPIMPPENLNQQRVQAPPPGLPTEPAAPQRPTAPMPPRPLTPSPVQQTSKLPPLPPLPTQRPNLPPLPPIPAKQSTAPAPSSKGGKGKLILIGIVSVLIISFVAGEIWWFFLRQQPVTDQASTQDLLPPPQELQPLLPVEQTPSTNEAPETVTPTRPVGLLSYNQSEQIIDVMDIKNLSSESVAENALVKLVIQKSTTDATTGEATTAELATIDELINALKIKIPSTLKKELSGEFDVFAFGGNTFDKTECEKAKNSSVSCYGPRLGMAFKVLDPAKINPLLKSWEKTMATDLKPIILTKAVINTKSVFQSGIYQDQTIRYKNLPINTITVEYVLVGDTLIISTSKSSILEAIDSVNVTNP